jgi:anaphase-promoting complex subunit 4
MAEPLAEKVVKPAINPSLVAYCPTMDLIALSTVDEHTQVYRLNGQKVFSVQSKLSSTKVAQIKWKPNGKTTTLASFESLLSCSRERPISRYCLQ